MEIDTKESTGNFASTLFSIFFSKIDTLGGRGIFHFDCVCAEAECLQPSADQ